eukprot:scaffold3422_cov28-Tisochrysis_lutea.AAC.2
MHQPKRRSWRRLSIVEPVGRPSPRKWDGPSTSTPTRTPPHSTARSSEYPSALRTSSATERPSDSSAYRTVVCMREGQSLDDEKASFARCCKDSGSPGQSQPIRSSSQSAKLLLALPLRPSLDAPSFAASRLVAMTSSRHSDH